MAVQPSRVRSHRWRDRFAPEAITAAGVESKGDLLAGPYLTVTALIIPRTM
jgi:hypothetical protein